MNNFEYCRTCLTDNIKLKYSLFENNLLNILMECTSIKLNTTNENFSTFICDTCYNSIKNIENFKEKCLKSEQILENKYKNNGNLYIKVDPEDIFYNSDMKNDEDYSDDQLKENKEEKPHKRGHENLYDSSKPKLNKNEFLCKYCNQTYIDLAGLRRHYISTKHKLAFLEYQKNKLKPDFNKNVEKFVKKDEYFKKTSDGKFICEFCSKIFDYLLNIHDHYFRNHENEINEKYGDKNTKKYYCFICKVSYEKPLLFNHCRTKNHKINIGLAGEGKVNVEVLSSDNNAKKDEYGHYCCEPCDLIFIDHKRYEFHIESPLHKSFTTKIKTFNFNNDDLKNLKNALLKEEENKLLASHPFFCNKCKKFYKKKQELDKHLESHDQNPEIDEIIISEKLENNNNLLSNNVVKVCKFCSKCFKNLAKHLKTSSHKEAINKINMIVRRAQAQLVSKSEHFCNICNITLPNKKRYIEHIKTKFHNKMSRNMNKHEEEDENEGDKYEIDQNAINFPQYHCDDCNYTYFSKRQFNTHMLTHVNEDNKKDVSETYLGYKKCKYCDRRFHKKFILYKHINFHEGIVTEDKNKPIEVICYICGLKIKSLDNHLIKVHQIYNNIPIKCKLCKEVKQIFDSNESLLEHLKSVHNTTKNKERINCPTCGVNISKPNLSIHMKRVHFNIRPFQCEVCQKRFKDKHNLKEHFRSHTDERPFTCETCFQTFRSKGTLNKHLNIHTGQRFPCDICGKSFTQKACIRTHKKKDHPESL